MTSTTRQTLTLFSLAAFSLCGSIRAADQKFDFKDPKQVQSISFVLDSTLEPIMGLASGITGTMTYDPANPKSTKGTIVVDAKSLHTENNGMKKTLHNSDWMDVENYKTIEFKINSVKSAKKLGENRHELKIEGDFTCRGVTKSLNVPVVATFLPDMLGKRQRGGKGDLLVLRSEFEIKRTDYGIKPNMGDMVVSDDIELRIALVGFCPK